MGSLRKPGEPGSEPLWSLFLGGRLFKEDIDSAPLKGNIDIDVEVDMDIDIDRDSCVGCVQGTSKSIQYFWRYSSSDGTDLALP